MPLTTPRSDILIAKTSQKFQHFRRLKCLWTQKQQSLLEWPSLNQAKDLWLKYDNMKQEMQRKDSKSLKKNRKKFEQELQKRSETLELNKQRIKDVRSTACLKRSPC